MKILLISTNFSPELTGIGKYSGEMIDWFVHKGYDIRVICSPPYYPQWETNQDYSYWKYNKEVSVNKTIYRCPIWIPKRLSGLKRLIHLISFAISSFPVILLHVFWRPQIVISVEPSLFNSFGALTVSKLSGAKSILHIQDFEVNAAFELGILKINWAKKFIYSFEYFLMKRFDKVSSISEAMLDKLNQKGIVQKRRILFPNWVDTEFIHPLEAISKYREELNIPLDRTVALYSGNIGEKQGLEIVIEAARNLINKNIQFIICWSGAAESRLKALAKGLDNIIWLPLQPIERLNDFLNVADIHLLPQQADVADLVMPSKLTGMLSSGRPIIATAHVDTQVGNVVKDCGIVVSPGDLCIFSDAIQKLSSNVDLRNKLGRKAREYAEDNLQYDVIMKDFNSEVLKLIR